MPENGTVNTANATASGSDLRPGMKLRHLTMMGLGSAIGAGLFLGTGIGIGVAGPAVLVSYAVAGAIVVFVMRMLGELGAAIPTTGSFAEYARLAYGRPAGFALGWLYWFMLILVLGAEMVSASAIMAGWLGTDPWVPALASMLVIGAVNLTRVRNFGEFEFWFAAIKVAVLLTFLVIGGLLVFGVLGDAGAVGTTNFLGRGGFMPTGVPGVATALLAVAFAFGGIEIVTIAAAESEDPARSITRAVTSVIWRIGVFYLGSVLVITLLLPWDSQGAAASAAESPFTAVLGLTGFDGAVGFMEAVIVVALLSAFNAQIYASSRIAYAQATRGDGPSWLAAVDARGVPRAALLVSVAFGFGSVIVVYYDPGDALSVLLNAVGCVLIIVWVGIVLSQLRLRPRLEAEGLLRIRMWGHPWVPVATLVLIGALTALMLTTATGRFNIVLIGGITAALLVLGAVLPVSGAARRPRRSARRSR